MTYIIQDQVGMFLRIKWVCFEKAEPRSTDQLHAKVGASAKKKCYKKPYCYRIPNLYYNA